MTIIYLILMNFLFYQSAFGSDIQSMMTLQISKKILSTSLEQPSPQCRNLCEWQSGYLSCSEQCLHGNLDFVLTPSSRNAVIGINYRSQVDANVRTYVDGHISHRFVSFNTQTIGSTNKWAIWTTQGLETIHGATTSADTSFFNPRTSGILFSGIFLGQLESRVGEIRNIANTRLSTQANEIINKAVGAQMNRQGEAYRSHAYSQHFADGKFPGKTFAQTSNDYVFVQSFVEDQEFYAKNGRIFSTGDHLPPFIGSVPDVGFRISEKFINQYAKNILGGSTWTLEQLRSTFARLGLSAFMDNSEAGSATKAASIQFDEQSPLTINFNLGKITIKLRPSIINNILQPATTISADYSLKIEQGEIVGIRDTDLNAMSEISNELGQVVGDLFPPKITLDSVGGDFVPTIFAKFLNISDFSSNDGWLVLGWTL